MIALLRSYILQYNLDLQNAVLLLGGSAALMRLQCFRRALAGANPKFTRLQHELSWLCDLINLEIVGDIDSEESATFALIEQNDDAVCTICVLTDISQSLIDSFDDFSDTASGVQSEAAARVISVALRASK